MNRPMRPALAQVLAAVSACTSTAEALESLATSRLWPWSSGEGPRWWCGLSAGSDVSAAMSFLDRGGCTSSRFGCDCSAIGYFRNPHTHADLVAVASLGVETLMRACDLADVIARQAGCDKAIIVFVVLNAEALREHHRRSGRRYTSSEWSLAAAFSRAVSVPGEWPTVCPESLPSPRKRGRSAASSLFGDGVFTSSDAAVARQRDVEDVAAIHRAWSAMGDLAALGVHLLALTEKSVLIGVEAIGDDRE